MDVIEDDEEWSDEDNEVEMSENQRQNQALLEQIENWERQNGPPGEENENCCIQYTNCCCRNIILI